MTANGLKETGRYTTDSTYDGYGDLATQGTSGESLWFNSDPAVMDYIVVGNYTTTSTIALGEVTKTITTGNSLSKRDISVVTGTYTTTTNFNEFGDAHDSKTLGVSQRMSANGLKETGRYTTDSTYRLQ